MSYRFREIRKGECVKVLEFAKAHGCTVESQALHHHLSLVAKKEGELVAAAMCVEQQPCQFTIEIVHHEGAEPSLITELTDLAADIVGVFHYRVETAILVYPLDRCLWPYFWYTGYFVVIVNSGATHLARGYCGD